VGDGRELDLISSRLGEFGATQARDGEKELMAVFPSMKFNWP
jgi:hypothetical protein